MTGQKVGHLSHLDPDGVMKEPDDLNHYVNKSAITESIVTGIPVKALCGVRFVIESHGDGETSIQGAAVCPLCGIVYAGMQP